MKIFKFKFNKPMLGAIAAGLAVAVAAFCVNTYFVLSEGISSAANPTYPIIQYTVTYLVAVLLFIILISMLLSSYYAVDGKFLKTSFGIIKSKYDIGKIETVLLDRTENKLSVYFDENTFIVIAVKEEWYEDFIDALIAANSKIEFAIQSKENENKDNDKKN